MSNEKCVMSNEVMSNVAVDDNVQKTTSATANKVFDFYLNNINSLPTMIEIEQLKSYQAEIGDDLICYAIEKAVENKSRSLAYIKGILNSWIKKGITTLEEAKEERKPTKEEQTTEERNEIVRKKLEKEGKLQ